MVQKRHIVSVHKVFYAEIRFSLFNTALSQCSVLCLFVYDVVTVKLILIFLAVKIDYSKGL